MNADALARELGRIDAEIRFDRITRALYATDASVYLIEPLGVVLPRTTEALIEAVRVCIRHQCPITMRAGGTSQAGQAIGAGVVIDVSKYLHRVLECNPAERWVRVEPGIVLDELNAFLRPHGLRFAPDISTAARACVGGMMANNSSGARSVLYGKTIDHVMEQRVLLSDGSIVDFRPLDSPELDAVSRESTLEGECYRIVQRLAAEHREEIARRYPKVMRRVAGYNLDEFVDPGRPFNLCKMMVGSEGTLGVILEAKLNLVPLPRAKAVVTIQFEKLLDALGATPAILAHRPSAVEVMDGFILSHTRQSPRLQRIRESFITGEPGALLCVEMYDDSADALPPRIDALIADLRSRGLGDRFHRALALDEQARIWSLREAALGLSMAMKDDAKSLSFVEDTAVAPEKLRDYIERFLAILERHGTTAGVYAHASVGCLHVRPVVNMKVEEGVRKFEAIANEVADLVLEFGGAIAGEHGDGLVRSAFIERAFGPVLYDAFRTVKRTFDPRGLFNPGKIIDAPPITANLRFGAGYVTPKPATHFDYSDYGGMGGAVEMCSGLGACRKKLEGTMCPSYMVTREEKHSTRGRANALRMAMLGRLDEAGLGDDGMYDVLDLCLECRACKAECPVGVDMARFKSEFLADYWARHGTPAGVRMLANAHASARWGSRLAALANALAGSAAGRRAAQKLIGVDARRPLPRWSATTLDRLVKERDGTALLFCDTFTNYYNPEVGVAALRVMRSAGVACGLAGNACCGRPLISKGLLGEARAAAEENTRKLHDAAAAGKKIVFVEPSCLSAVKEDAPSLLRDESRKQAETVAGACVSFEEFAGALDLPLRRGPDRILLHSHCHQKAMGLLPAAMALLARVPGASVVDLDAGCCGMAGSFGYTHYDVSRQIGERKLLPAVRAKQTGDVVVAPGVSCRHQIADFTEERALHPAILLRDLLA